MPVIDTAAGRVRGVVARGVVVFRGIPYAAPPLGAHRFRAPTPQSPWAEVREAFEFGPYAVQGPVAAESKSRLRPQSEDCLRLNVWTPSIEGRRPVMVYVHGGAFDMGGTAHAAVDGSLLASDGDVVVVSVAHRLGVLGFLYLGGISPDAVDTANVSLLDLVEGLRWVRDNISSFGGDANRVTIFGESGGGWKICNLLAMPSASGLFHRAIIQSGSYPHALTLDEADRQARCLMAELEIPANRLDLLANVPLGRIVRPDPPADRAKGRVREDGTWQWNFQYAPVVDGAVLPREPFAPDSPGVSADVPLLVGVARDEFDVFIDSYVFPEIADPVAKTMKSGLDRERAKAALALYGAEIHGLPGRSAFAEVISDRLFFHPAILQAERRIARNGSPVFMYIYSWGWPHFNDRAIHAGDIYFVFGNLAELYPGADREVLALSRTMRLTWAAFAHGGDPNNAGIPKWNAYELERRPTLIFDRECRLENDPRAARRRLVQSERSDEWSR